VLAATTTPARDPFVVGLSGLEVVDVGGVRSLMAGRTSTAGAVAHPATDPAAACDRLIRILGVDGERGFLTEAF
jgi:hypothetical protein